MKDFIVLIYNNWTTIIVALLAIVGGASAIAKITPTPKDDAFLAKIVAVLNAIALNPKK